VPSPDATSLLYARGDLLREEGAFRVADRELRLAVANQWPKLGVFLGANVALEAPMQSVAVSLPLDAPPEARAMVRAREAARRRFDEAVLDALHDARARRLDLERAEARERGARAEREATRALVEAAQARIETEAEGAFAFAVQAAVDEVRAASRLRAAAVDAVRARVRAAFAAGWPGVEVLEACR
jgi:hypothetical protein